MSSDAWRDPSTLRERYVEQEQTTQQMADALGCTRKTINKWLNHHEIPRRDPDEERRRGVLQKPAGFRTRADGYERLTSRSSEGRDMVYHHRLLAVLKYGFDSIQGREVHHRNNIPWDNRFENIELIEKSDHGEMHANERWGN